MIEKKIVVKHILDFIELNEEELDFINEIIDKIQEKLEKNKTDIKEKMIQKEILYISIDIQARELSEKTLNYIIDNSTPVGDGKTLQSFKSNYRGEIIKMMFMRNGFTNVILEPHLKYTKDQRKNPELKHIIGDNFINVFLCFNKFCYFCPFVIKKKTDCYCRWEK